MNVSAPAPGSASASITPSGNDNRRVLAAITYLES